MMACKPKKKYFQLYKESYTAEFPCIKRSSKGEKYVFCDVCMSDFTITHGGRNDVYRHVTHPQHVENVKIADSHTKKLVDFFKPNSTQDDVTRAELLFTSFLIDHNVPLSAASHAGPLFRKMFPKNEIAKRYGCGKTKTAAVVMEMAKDRTSSIVKMLQEQSFAAACDGSHESDYKLYPVVVSYFNEELGRIENTLLSIPDLEGNSTGENISSLILNVFEKYKIPFQNCIAFSADNAAVMQGEKNGVISYLAKKNENIIAIGCCCHLIHLAAEKAAATLPANVEDAVIDIFYYLKKSANRKESLKKFQELYGKEAQKILKHVPTRWLSLGRSLSRVVNQWDPLMSFFRAEVTSCKLPASLSLYKKPKLDLKKNGTTEGCSEDTLLSKDSNAETPTDEIENSTENKGAKTSKTARNVTEDNIKDKLLHSEAVTSSKKNTASANKQNTSTSKKRKNSNAVSKKAKKQKNNSSSVLSKEEKIFMFLSSDVNKAYSLFLLTVIPSFEKVNTILQSSSPQIYRLRALLLDLLKELYSKFVKASEVKGKELSEVNFHLSSNHKEHKDLIIGNATLNLISKCSEEQQRIFYAAVIKYFVTACEYILKKFPLQNDVLKHAQVADLKKIEDYPFSSVKYFVDLFPILLKRKDGETEIEAMDQLQREFSELQLEDLSSIIDSNKEVDMQWAEIKQLKGADGLLKYEKIADGMLSVLLIPHSNAECERIFSLVRKNRTESRAVMSNKTLESLMILKTRDSKPCFEQIFAQEFLRKAKKATAACLNPASTSSDVDDDVESL